jgi:NADH:ubiquinone oxidoreductase subunit
MGRRGHPHPSPKNSKTTSAAICSDYKWFTESRLRPFVSANPLAIEPARLYIPANPVLEDALMGLLRALFIWWRNATPGTILHTWLRGVPVGTDEVGNRYYRTKDGKRRWVLYNGTVEASRVPAEWHGWLHHTFKDPPSGPAKLKPWEKDHLPNLSGTKGAYYPPGSLARGGVRAPATGDYEPWRPA